MRYFEGLTQENEIKAKYKDLAKKYHPDLGGDVETMKEINSQYESVMLGAYQKAGKSISEIDELMKNDKKAMEVLKSILGIYGIKVELCGSWIWITGDTKRVKDQLKQASFRWASKKLAWYWRAEEEAGKRFGKSFSLNDIREKYGSSSMKKNGFVIA